MSIEVNGVTLPDIPADILASYPYVTIYRLWDSANDPEPTTDTFVFLAADSPILYEEDYLFTEGESVSVLYYLDTSAWVTDETIENGEGLGFEVGAAWETLPAYSLCSTELKWSNHDIYEADPDTGEPSDTIYFARNDSDTATDTKPIYKRVSGAWVKQTAYERQSGEWVQISTGASA